MYDIYEDGIRLSNGRENEPFVSPYQDFRYYDSSVTPGVRLAVNVIKPARPGYVLIQLHGWHMSMPKPVKRPEPIDGNDYLIVQVDMRGRAFSGGRQDCNGLELIDIYDAVQFALAEYGDWIGDPSTVYLEGGSGGGGNALATVAKFPDLFAAATALYGMSDYALWYDNDAVGEFRDEMDVWIGCPPEEDPERYKARSGIDLLPNLLTPLYMAHGDGDIRVPASHSQRYVERAQAVGKSELVRYDELAGVGGRGHLDHVTEEQKRLIESGSEDNRAKHREPIRLPEAGSLLVGGYVYTRPFRIRLESIDRLAVAEYDLTNGTFALYADKPCRYTIETAGGEKLEGQCLQRQLRTHG